MGGMHGTVNAKEVINGRGVPSLLFDFEDAQTVFAGVGRANR